MNVPRRILVKEVNWLGDLVMSLSALWAVRRAFPDARLSVLVLAPLASFFDGVDWVDEVLPYLRPRALGRSLRETWRIVRMLRVRDFDLGIAFPRSFSSALWMYGAGIPERVGVRGQWRTPLLTRAVRCDTKDPNRHQRLAWLDLVKYGLSIPDPDPEAPPFAPHPAHLRRMQARLAATFGDRTPFVALAPGAAFGPAKQWPRAHWLELIRALDERGRGIVLLGTASERSLCEDLLADARPRRATVLAGETSVGELSAVLRIAAGYVGNDSGASHLAAALGTPTVALFGSTNPVRTAPLGPRCSVLYDPPPCSPCLARTCRFGHTECLQRLRPDAVLTALSKIGALRDAAV
jgi:heptosyltransferase-2